MSGYYKVAVSMILTNLKIPRSIQCRKASYCCLVPILYQTASNSVILIARYYTAESKGLWAPPTVQHTEFSRLYFRSHYLLLPSHHEFLEWVNYTFEATAKVHRAAAKHHPDPESLLKAGVATVRTVLKRGEEVGGWMVPTKTTTLMEGTAGKSYERPTRVSTATTGSTKTVKKPPERFNLGGEDDLCRAHHLPTSAINICGASGGTWSLHSPPCVYQGPLKPPGPSTPLPAKHLTPPAQTTLAPKHAQGIGTPLRGTNHMRKWPRPRRLRGYLPPSQHLSHIERPGGLEVKIKSPARI
ncbi:hypothetical protein K440DRAFT_687266 [Wilcoxina mikolae CBS 423.85]|nr:hypothetical protein K440DRAFT_687266 [Wilcoxina mikolae CBS 423.85]